MSDTPFEVVEIKSVHTHPHADRLEIAKVLGTQFVTGKGDFQPGDLCVYFPPDMLIPTLEAEALGIANYLKYAIYPGDTEKFKCRIAAIRLRGVASFGFGISVNDLFPIIGPVAVGDDVTADFGGVKYQPPEKFIHGDSLRQPGGFHTYTSIQHYYRYDTAIVEGTPVRITEKIHGTNSRVGLVMDDGFEYMCGTHHRRVKHENSKGRLSLYWGPMTENMREMLAFISHNAAQSITDDNVIVFGEIYGNKIQPMDYGCQQGKGYRVFDISINGDYLDWEDVETYCTMFGIETVPVLYEGPFSPELIDKFISGPTTLADAGQIKSSFKGREGIVITPLVEEYSHQLGGRLILKAVSSDYYEAMK
jgi:RNA ligase (TIGR02306 family)